ncbi:MAG: DUF2061 domain-containing protein [Planctomycetia bacterium]|nr:DUF2061 domain-containing protein [Planctomycetia bacterium]
MVLRAETHARSITKALVWRAFGLILLVGISYAYNRDVTQALTVGLIFNSIRLVLYYFHERIWNRIHWGVKPPPEYQI